jgi:hypothetical protein
MKIQLLLILTMLFTFSYQAQAINTAQLDADGTTLTVTGEKQNVFNKVGTWFKTQKNKAVNFVVKKAMAIDWSDDRTVLKYWIIAFVAAVVLWVLGVVLVIALPVGSFLARLPFWLSYLCGLAGTILFWYWIYLKFIA